MACTFCGGNHHSDYCPGYNSYSMNKSLKDINSGINILSELNESSLDLISGHNLRIIDSQNRIVESNQKLSENIQNIGFGISDAIKDSTDSLAENIDSIGIDISAALNYSTEVNATGYRQISDSIYDTGDKLVNAGLMAAEMVSSSLIGIGGILQYRERMDQLRFKTKMRFNDESSVAGKARRELLTATAFLVSGDLMQAEKHLNKSIKYFPSSAETFRILSIAQSKQEKHNDAITSLKVALELANHNKLFPIYNSNQKSSHFNNYEKIKVSTLAQLTQEYAIENQLNKALSALNEGIQEFPDNSDLHFQRVRILSKTNQWENKFEEYLNELIMISPRHFNILYLGQQFKSRTNDIQNFLKSKILEKRQFLKNKIRVLQAVTEGKSDKLMAVSAGKSIENLSYTQILEQIDIFNNEISKDIKRI